MENPYFFDNHDVCQYETFTYTEKEYGSEGCCIELEALLLCGGFLMFRTDRETTSCNLNNEVMDAGEQKGYYPEFGLSFSNYLKYYGEE